MLPEGEDDCILARLLQGSLGSTVEATETLNTLKKIKYLFQLWTFIELTIHFLLYFAK